MIVARSIALFDITLAWLVWQGVREHKGWIWLGAGVIALGLYGVVATFQSADDFGRILAAYGGIFVVGSITVVVPAVSECAVPTVATCQVTPERLVDAGAATLL